MGKTILRSIFAIFVALVMSACGGSSDSSNCYTLNEQSKGCIETIDHIVNTTISSRDDNVLKAEYQAGFIQGKLQRESMIAARDNTWDGFYLVDPSHNFPKQRGPSQAELDEAVGYMRTNYDYTIKYAKAAGGELGTRMKRILFRMLGIYHGASIADPEALDFGGDWLPGLDSFKASELGLTYGNPEMTFMDVYWLTANQDVSDVIGYAPSLVPVDDHPGKCSAFVKKLPDDVVITHNSWVWFNSQTQALNLSVNDDIVTINVISPGTVSSLTDFGYNNKGMMFNETTHHATYSEPKVDRLWMWMRAALAEQFSSSLDEFYSMLSLEASGTYQNGYILADAKSRQIGLVEMSFRSFVYYQPNGNGGYNIVTKPEGRSKVYDTELVTSDYILGINFPASKQIQDDLQAKDNRPARRQQFMAMIGGVTDLESAKSLITYTDDPGNPLSIYGRWDLGYGDTPPPGKTVPDGSVDAKAALGSMALALMAVNGNLVTDSGIPSFWMKFGTPKIDGKPFIWSESQWSDQPLRDAPNVVDGDFQLLGLHLE